MTVEIRCPACGHGYLLAEGSTNVEFPCPACAAPVTVRDAAAPARSGSADPRPAALPPAGHEVECPRCRLRFRPPQAAPQAGDARPRVLLLDRPGYFLDTARDVLGADYDVCIAGNVAEAECLLARGDIDLLVLDVALDRGPRGPRLLGAHKRCPVLIYSASDEAEVYGDRWERLRALGADDIVIKGMNVAESLTRKAAALLGLPVAD